MSPPRYPVLVRQLRELLDLDVQGDRAIPISPGIVLANLENWWEYETQFSRPCVGRSNCSAVAGQYSQIQAWNPASSGVNMHLDTALIDSATAGIVQCRWYNTAFGNLTASGLEWRDRRQSGAPACQIRYTNNASIFGATADTIAAIYLPATETIPLPLDCLLKPGQGLNFAYSAVNVEHRVNLWWDEIPI